MDRLDIGYVVETGLIISTCSALHNIKKLLMKNRELW